MLRLPGTRKTLCDGVSRRDFLTLGSVGLGLSLADALRLRAAAPEGAGPRFGQAKACILLFPYGSPPQHETFDPKPDAPAEIQGELKDRATAVPTNFASTLPLPQTRSTRRGMSISRNSLNSQTTLFRKRRKSARPFPCGKQRSYFLLSRLTACLYNLRNSDIF